MDEQLLIGALIVLGVFVVLIFYRGGKVIILAIREEAHRKNSRLQIEHPKLGTLSGELGVWSGQFKVNGVEIPFEVGGTEEQPDANLLLELQTVLSRFDHFHKTALDYLHKENPSSTPLRFTFHEIDVLYPQDPEQFTMSFLLEGDDDGIWRVEFERDEPVFMGRDD